MAMLTDDAHTSAQRPAGPVKSPLWRRLVIIGLVVGTLAVGVAAVLMAQSMSEQSAALEAEIMDVQKQLTEAEEVQPITEEEAAEQAQSCAAAGNKVAEIQTSMTQIGISSDAGKKLSDEMATYVEGGTGAATAPWIVVDGQCEAIWSFSADYEYTGSFLNVVWLCTATDKSDTGRTDGVIGWASAVYSSETGTFADFEWGTCPLYGQFAPTDADGVN